MTETAWGVATGARQDQRNVAGPVTVDAMRTLTRLTLTGAAAAGLLLTGMPSASAAIVPDVGIKGIKLDHRKKTVIRKLGEPNRIEKGVNDFGKWQVLHYSRKFKITLTNKVVTQLRTTSAGQRTATGVGVGSTKREVKDGVAGVTCERSAGMLSCHTGDFLPGQAMTVFEFRRGEVTMVFVARVLD